MFLWPVTNALRLTSIAQGALGGGGYVKQLSFSDDGVTRIHLNDVNEAYRWNSTTAQWDKMLGQSSAPSAYALWGSKNQQGMGVVAGAVAPSDHNRVYLLVDAADTYSPLWRSNDGGLTFSATAITQVPASGALAERLYGPRMAVDPNNPDVVYFSDQAGVPMRTLDGGATVEVLTALAISALGFTATNAATAAGGTVLHFAAVPSKLTSLLSVSYESNAFISNLDTPLSFQDHTYRTDSDATSITLAHAAVGAGVSSGDRIVLGAAAGFVFDRSSSAVSGKTQGIYIGWSWGAGSLWHSGDGGTNWAAETGGPVSFRRMHGASDGTIWVSDNTPVSNGNLGPHTIWKKSGGTWTNITTNNANGGGNPVHGIATDPATPSHVATVCEQGNPDFSADGGVTWLGNGGVSTRVTTGDVTWLNNAGTLENSMSAGDLAFDPVVPGKIIFSEGIGIWTYPFATSFVPSVTMQSITKGNDELLVMSMAKAPGAKLLLTCWDRFAFRLTDPAVFPTHSGLPTQQIVHGTGIAYCLNDNTKAVALGNTTVYLSSDGGDTWTPTPTTPSNGGFGGAVVMLTSLKIVLFPGNNGTPVYTTDGGSTWQNVTFTGISAANLGWNFSWTTNYHFLCADLVDANTLYAINFNSTDAGIWKSIDGGATFALQSGTNVTAGASGLNKQLVAVPGNAGHLFFANGTNFNGGYGLFRSIDHGASLHTVSGVQQAWQVDCGPSAPGNSFPSVFLTGFANGDTKPGVYRCDDMGATLAGTPTWQLLSSAPANSTDIPTCLRADPDTFGTFYVGLASTGYVSGHL